jgi:competence protein ComGC
MRLESGKSAKAAIASSKRKFEAQEQRTRQLMIDLAARAYELDKGHRPASVADLVPEYLKAVPKDPIAGTNIVLP